MFLTEFCRCSLSTMLFVFLCLAHTLAFAADPLFSGMSHRQEAWTAPACDFAAIRSRPAVTAPPLAAVQWHTLRNRERTTLAAARPPVPPPVTTPTVNPYAWQTYQQPSRCRWTPYGWQCR